MTNRELITNLLLYPMDWEVEVLDGASMQIAPPCQFFSDDEATISLPLFDSIKDKSHGKIK